MSNTASIKPAQNSVTVSPTGVRVTLSPAAVSVVSVAKQGVPGRDGVVPGGDDLLLATRRLSEFDTEQKRTEARQNLGVQIIDAGEFL